MKDELPFTRTLGSLSAGFISKLLERGKTMVTLDDAVRVYGGDRHETTRFLSALIKRGILARINAGIYLILQMGQENIQLNNWPVIAHELAGTNDYFLSHYSAMRLHGMTTHALFDAYITMPKRHRIKIVNNISYHFIYTNSEYLWGKCTHWVTKQDKVFVSDMERTLLDGLDRPELCGGIKEVMRGIWVSQKKIDWKKMVEYAVRFPSRASVKRLGFILEILDIGANYLPVLAKTIASAKDYILLDPNGSREGKYLRRWRVQININIEELRASVWE